MKPSKLVFLVATFGFLSACASPDGASVKGPFTSPAFSGAGGSLSDDNIMVFALDVRVRNLDIEVPSSLSVSEANLYLPRADIVWRGDEIGDRHQQVQAIFETAGQRAVADVNGEMPVDIEIEVTRFHALTEKARYSTGGVHNITFVLTIRDASSGQVLGTPKTVRADLEAYGGDEAIQADARGETQKVRITEHLAEVIRQELSVPGGFTNPNLGIIQAMNNRV